MNLAHVLLVAGAAFQIGGFFFLAMELERVRREELGRPTRRKVMVAALGRSLERLLRRPRQTVQVRAVADSLALADFASAVVSRAPSVSLEDKVRRLEAVTEDLQRELREFRTRQETRMTAMAERLTATEQRLTETAQQAEAARQRELERKVSVETWSTLAFVLGTALGVVGSLL
jgi:vacuolar-type H+-ATPase subunit I/STV1